MSKKGSYEKYLKKYIKKNKYLTVLVGNDKDPGKTIAEGLTKRDYSYSSLLSNYITLSKVRNIIKEIHKWLFFWIIVGGGMFVCYILLSYISSSSIANNDSSSVVSFIGALVSLISTVISIPVIIAKYLFNNNEDNNMTSIITKTQEHDNVEIGLLAERFKKDGQDALFTNDEKANDYQEKNESQLVNNETLEKLNQIFSDDFKKEK